MGARGLLQRRVADFVGRWRGPQTCDKVEEQRSNVPARRRHGRGIIEAGEGFSNTERLYSKSGDLPAAVRAAVEQLLGRAIAADEEVSVSAVPPQQGLPLADRKAVARQLDDFLDRRAEKVKDLPDEEMDLAIDEAAHHVRHSLK